MDGKNRKIWAEKISTFDIWKNIKKERFREKYEFTVKKKKIRL